MCFLLVIVFASIIIWYFFQLGGQEPKKQVFASIERNRAITMLDSQYRSIFKNKNATLLANAYSNIIQVKSCLYDELVDYNQPMYKDIKLFVDAYLKYISYEDYGYDKVNTDKIVNLVDCIRDNDKKLELYYYVFRKLRRYMYEDESDTIANKIKEQYRYCLFDKNSCHSRITCLIQVISNNFWIAVLFLLLLLSLYFCVLLPNMDPTESWLTIATTKYTDIWFVNQLVNFIFYLFGSDLGMQVKANNIYGATLLLFMNTINIVYVAGYFCTIIINKITLSK